MVMPPDHDRGAADRGVGTRDQRARHRAGHACRVGGPSGADPRLARAPWRGSGNGPVRGGSGRRPLRPAV